MTVRRRFKLKCFEFWILLATAFLSPLFFPVPPVFGAQSSEHAEKRGKPVTPKDFVRARKLETQVEGALGKFLLTREIYEGLIRSQNYDLAVFDSRGEIVPFVVLPASPIYDASSRSDLPVPFFELPSGENTPSASDGVAPVDIYVRTGSGGQVVEIKGNPAGKNSGERRYLLDFSSVSVNENADSRRLDLFIPENLKLNATIDVFQSENLRDWTPVSRNIPLIQLQNDDARLSSNSIELEDRPRRYLLLRITGADVSFALKETRYSFTSLSSLLREERATFDGTLTMDRRAVEYDVHGAFPVSKVGFALQEAGLHKVRYSSRAAGDAAWRPIGTTELTFIRNSAGETRMNPSVPIDLREDRYWRIDFESAFSGPPPRMKINWRPCEVYFLAQGPSPWILAYGSSRKDLHGLQNPSLVRDGELRKTAMDISLGEFIEPDKALSSAPGGEKAAEARFEGIEWQRWLVWGFLILGALLLSAMALKLMKKN